MAQPIRLIVEAAGHKAPWPLRAVRSQPEQQDTRGKRYLARSIESAELHPGLPKGLILGRVRDRVYEAEGFVIERYLEPLWDARGLVQVLVLFDRRTDAALIAKLVARQQSGPQPARGRHTQAVLWSSPAHLPYRRFLLLGKGLRAGAAVLDGERCIGRVIWAFGAVGMAAALSEQGAVLPLIWLADDALRVQALVLEGRGSSGHASRFRIAFPPRDVLEDLKGGSLFTGTSGLLFPAGLYVADANWTELGFLQLRSQAARDWPPRVEIMASPGGRQP